MNIAMPTGKETNERLFAIALLKHNMNATAAAREVFNMGKKGGRSRHTAESVGSEYRRKPEVQQYIAELVRTHLDPTQAITTIQKLASDTEHPATALSACTLILKLTGVYQEKREPMVVPQVQLVMPTPPKA